jgi:hypothetical protein
MRKTVGGMIGGPMYRIELTPKNIAIMCLSLLVALLLVLQWQIVQSNVLLCNSAQLKLANDRLVEGIEEVKRTGPVPPVLFWSRENLREYILQKEDLCH